MAKTKKMGLGGFLGGVLGGGAKAVKKAISNSPVKKALAGGIGAAKPSMGVAGKSRPMPIRDIGTGSMPRPGGIPKPNLGGPKPRVNSSALGLGKAMSKPPAGPVAKKIAGAGAGMAKAVMGRKAGGAVKKAAKK